MLTKFLLTVICGLTCICSYAQTISFPGNGDSLYPVTNKYRDSYSASPVYQKSQTSITGIVKDQGKYYITGAFTGITENNGSALVYDTATKTILNNRIWRINGRINTVVPDGQGGFFIGGTFTSVGDSSRKYIAQINSNGRPTSWKAACNGEVNSILKRNDTLFIGGAFTQFGGANRNCFAMYSALGNTLFIRGGSGIFNYMSVINTLLLHKDTLIYGGIASGLAGDYNHLRKYSFKNDFFLPFILPNPHEHYDIRDLNFSKDSSTLIFRYGQSFSDYVRAVDNRTGSLRYRIFTNANNMNDTKGPIHDLEIAGDKGYITGEFSRINYTNIYRKGLYVFDVATGFPLNDNLNLNEFASSVQHRNGKLYVSGKFTTINGVPRDQFAVLDTGTYNVNPFEFNPSDAISSITFSNNRALIVGFISGIHAIRKKGITAIDSASRAVTNLDIAYHTDPEGYIPAVTRMVKRGDTIFLLTNVDKSFCRVEILSSFKIYSATTGVEFTTNQLPFENVNDFLIEGNWMYVSYQSTLRRYSLPQ